MRGINRQRRGLFVAGIFIAIIALVVLAWANLQGRQTAVTFSSGAAGGLYHSLGIALSQSLLEKQSEIKINVLESAGSSENLLRVDRGEADLGLVQSDSVGGLNARSIAALYTETLHFVANSASGIRSIQGLQDYTINIGSVGSGTNQILRALFNFLGQRPENLLELPTDEAIQGLLSGEIDAAFFLSGVPSVLIDKLLSNQQLTLLPLVPSDGKNEEDLSRTSANFVRGFQTQYPYITPADIPMLTYSGRPASPVPTLGVEAVLVANRELSDSTAKTITEFIFNQRVNLASRNAVFSNLDESRSLSGLKFPLHPGAEAFFRRQEPGFLSKHAETLGLFVTVLVLAWSGLSSLRRNASFDRQQFFEAIVADLGNLSHDARMGSNTDYDRIEKKLAALRDRLMRGLREGKLLADSSFIVLMQLCDSVETEMNQRRQGVEVNGETGTLEES